MLVLVIGLVNSLSRGIKELVLVLKVIILVYMRCLMLVLFDSIAEIF